MQSVLICVHRAACELISRGDKIDGNKVPFSTSIRCLKKAKFDGKIDGYFRAFPG